jgi:protein gp37
MSVGTSIEWTESTWNPNTGCDRVSPGCDHCYALSLSGRLKAMGQPKYQTDGDPRTSGPGFGVAMHWDVVDQPLSWRRPQTVFVNSMSDLAHPRVTDEFIAAVFAVMGLADRHRYQILTKRPRRFRSLLQKSEFRSLVVQAMAERGGDLGFVEAVHEGDPAVWPLRSVWLGASAEDDVRARERLPLLADTPAAVRFISAEPLLEDITEGLHHSHPDDESGPVLASMDWVIVGGESGPDHRPMEIDWVRGIRDTCLRLDVPFFFKQWGGKTPKTGGRTLDGRNWDEMPGGPDRDDGAAAAATRPLAVAS